MWSRFDPEKKTPDDFLLLRSRDTDGKYISGLPLLAYNLLDISFRSNKPGSIVVYADGADSRVLQKLISKLGSEQKAQNALILTGFLSKLEKKSDPVSAARAKIARENFRELVGVSLAEFQRIVESINV